MKETHSCRYQGNWSKGALSYVILRKVCVDHSVNSFCCYQLHHLSLIYIGPYIVSWSGSLLKQFISLECLNCVLTLD